MPGRPHSSGRRSGPPSGGPHGGGGGSKSPKTKGPPPGGPHGGSTPPPKKKTVTTGGTSPFAYTKKKKWTPGPSKWPSSFQHQHKLRKTQLQNKLSRLRNITWKDRALSTINPWQFDEIYGDDGIHTTLGTRGLQKGLSDYMFGKGITSLQNLPPDAKLWMAHSPKPDDYAKIAKEGFSGVRPTSKITNLVSPRSWEQLLKGKNPLSSTGVYTAVGKTEKEALEAAAKFGKGPLTRGLGTGVDASKVFTAQVPRSTFPIHSGVTRISQMEVPSHIANKAFNIGDKGLKVGAAPAKGMIKSTVGRLLPGVGAALGGASALKHLQAGNYGQAAMAGLSMAPGPVGWAGLGGELALGALQNAKQIPNWQATRKYANGGIADLYRYGGFIG
jgi:hypothetical protein